MSSLANASIYQSKFCSRICVYTPALIFSSMNTIGPSLLPAKHPHIICDVPPSCRFPTTFLGRYFSIFPALPVCLQTQTVLVSLSFLTADSSDHATFFHMSTVQC